MERPPQPELPRNKVTKRVLGVLATLGILFQVSSTYERPVNLPPDFKIAGMGDSYTASSIVDDSTLAAGNPMDKICRRSDKSYVSQLAEMIGVKEQNVINTACSGDGVDDITVPRDGRPAQIDQLDQDADLVMLTIGANITDISGLLAECNQIDCTSDSEEFQTVVSRLGSEAYRNQLISALEAIHHKAPGAKILIVSYPKIFDSKLDFANRILIDRALLDAYYQFISTLNDILDQAVAESKIMGLPVNLVNPPDINTLSTRGTAFYLPGINMGSSDDPKLAFHPTEYGQFKIAEGIKLVLPEFLSPADGKMDVSSLNNLIVKGDN